MWGGHESHHVVRAFGIAMIRGPLAFVDSASRLSVTCQKSPDIVLLWTASIC
jgi:hypothetical protein